MISQPIVSLKPAETLNLYDFPQFPVTQPQFSHAGSSSCKEVTRSSLAFERKQALALGSQEYETCH